MRPNIGLSGLPTAPAEVRDAAEVWARGQGRHADVHFHPQFRCWAIELSLPSNHPQLRMWKEGTLKQPSAPTETVLLREWDVDAGAWAPRNIMEMGPSGVTTMLEKANVMSGRGEYPSLVAACEAIGEENARVRRDASQHIYDVGREIGAVARRGSLGLPQVSVVADLKSPNTPTKERTQ